MTVNLTELNWTEQNLIHDKTYRAHGYTLMSSL